MEGFAFVFIIAAAFIGPIIIVGNYFIFFNCSKWWRCFSYLFFSFLGFISLAFPLMLLFVYLNRVPKAWIFGGIFFVSWMIFFLMFDVIGLVFFLKKQNRIKGGSHKRTKKVPERKKGSETVENH